VDTRRVYIHTSRSPARFFCAEPGGVARARRKAVKRRKPPAYRALARRGKRFPWVRKGKKHLVYSSEGLDSEYCSGHVGVDHNAIDSLFDALGDVTCRECIEAFGRID